MAVRAWRCRPYAASFLAPRGGARVKRCAYRAAYPFRQVRKPCLLPNHPSNEIVAQQRDSFIERLLQATRGTLEIFSIYLSVRP